MRLSQGHADPRPRAGGHPPAARPAFPAAAFYGGLALFAALILLFRATDLDRLCAGAFYRDWARPWPGDRWAWSAWLHRFGQAPADVAGVAGLAAFGLSFIRPRWRPWRGPGLYLALLLALGPGLLCALLAKGLMGRPRPFETLGFGGLWAYRGPLNLGIPGRGRSFLSGHAATVWYFLGLAFLADARGRSWTLAAVVPAALAMALARVSQGAHWLSDTLLPGALLWSLAAGLSPLIRWQPSAAALRRPGMLAACAAAALACLSLGRVDYQDRRFSGPASAVGPQGPTHRALAFNGAGAPREVDVDVALEAGNVAVRFVGSNPRSGVLPLTADERFRGQGLPFATEDLEAFPLSPGALFRFGPRALALRLVQSLRGPWLARRERLTLNLPADLDVDARLRTRDGAITIAAFPAGRRVLLNGLPEGVAPPPGFRPFGGSQWLRPGRRPLIALDLQAPRLRFTPPPGPGA